MYLFFQYLEKYIFFRFFPNTFKHFIKLFWPANLQHRWIYAHVQILVNWRRAVFVCFVFSNGHQHRKKLPLRTPYTPDPYVQAPLAAYFPCMLDRRMFELYAVSHSSCLCPFSCTYLSEAAHTKCFACCLAHVAPDLRHHADLARGRTLHPGEYL